MQKYSKLREKLLKDPEVKKYYDELGPEFALIEMLIEQRMKKGLTQVQLAKKLGTKQPVISRLENGTLNPSIRFVQRVAKALDAKIKISIA